MFSRFLVNNLNSLTRSWKFSDIFYENNFFSSLCLLDSSWRNINNLRYEDDTTLMAKGEQELKSLLLRVKEEIEKKKKTGLKLNIQKNKIMTSGPITSWQIEGKKWKPWEILFSWCLKSLWIETAAMKLKDACSLEGKLWQT